MVDNIHQPALHVAGGTVTPAVLDVPLELGRAKLQRQVLQRVAVILQSAHQTKDQALVTEKRQAQSPIQYVMTRVGQNDRREVADGEDIDEIGQPKVHKAVVENEGLTLQERHGFVMDLAADEKQTGGRLYDPWRMVWESKVVTVNEDVLNVAGNGLVDRLVNTGHSGAVYHIAEFSREIEKGEDTCLLLDEGGM